MLRFVQNSFVEQFMGSQSSISTLRKGYFAHHAVCRFLSIYGPHACKMQNSEEAQSLDGTGEKYVWGKIRMTGKVPEYHIIGIDVHFSVITAPHASLGVLKTYCGRTKQTKLLYITGKLEIMP